ncbi:titin isoform X6 [Toxotes jaculatrix]|uniref:titin isoform X6 n=1 Tax=Toxotes jaculatrix TaxID=941984 RepID=UPI001B3B1B12|nr:titin isoform X6 [Toxotes jaculatrix]
MGTQGTGRKRSTKKERSTAEDDALNLIAREAEARLAAKRAARAEAREIRMKELERQQKEIFQVQKKYYGLNTKFDDRVDSRWGDIEQWMEDSERYSRSSQIHTLSDDDERMSVGSRGSVRSDLDAVGAYGGGGSSHKKSKKKKKHKHKDKDRNGYDDEYSVISSRSSRLSDESRVSHSSRLDLTNSYASSDLYSLNGLSTSRNSGSAFNGYQFCRSLSQITQQLYNRSSLYEDSLCSGSRRVIGSSCHPLEYTGYRNSSSRASSRASSARTSPVDNCGSVASFLRSAASSSGLPRDLDDVTIPDFSDVSRFAPAGARSCDVEDRDYLEKGSRAASALTAATLTSLGGTSSRRGSGETALTIDAETSIREIKDALAEVEEKYRKAMVSNAQLDNEKNNLMYQVDTLKDSLMELEELLSESRREYEEKVKEYEREKHAHSVLQFQFNEMKETLKQSEELLNEIRQLRMKQDGFVREISDLQETVEWKDKKIGALERQKEYTDAIRTERDELREEVVKLKDILKKHGIVLGPDLNVNGDIGEAEVDGSPGGDTARQPAQDSQTSPTEGNSMLGNTEETQLRSSSEEEVDPEQHQEMLKEEDKENQLSSDTLCNVADASTVETSREEQPAEERQSCLSTEKDSVGESSLSNDLPDVNNGPITEAEDVNVCSADPQEIVTNAEENIPETEMPESVDLGESNNPGLEETETKSSGVDARSDDKLCEEQVNKQDDAEEGNLANPESRNDVVKEENVPHETISAVPNIEPQQEPENAEEAENDEAEEAPSKSQGATASGKKKKKKRRGKKKGGNQQKDGAGKGNGKTEQDVESSKKDNQSTTEPNIDDSVTETIKESKMGQVNEQDRQETEEVDAAKAVEPTDTFPHKEESRMAHVTNEHTKDQSLETETAKEIKVVAPTETLSDSETPKEIRVDYVTNEKDKEHSLESETVEAVEAEAEAPTETHIETLEELGTEPTKDERDGEQSLETESVGKVESITSPPETNLSTSDCPDTSNSTEITDGLDKECTCSVDNSVSGHISTNGVVIHSNSQADDHIEDEAESADEVKPECAANNPESSLERSGEEKTEAESHVSSNDDVAADVSESTNNSEREDFTGVSPPCTDECFKSSSDSEPPSEPSVARSSLSHDSPIEVSGRGPEEATETVKDEEEPGKETEQECFPHIVISLCHDGSDSELKQDGPQEEELNRDLKEPEDFVESDSSSHHEQGNSCDGESLAKNTDALDAEKLETVGQVELLDDVESKTSDGVQQTDESNQLSLETSDVLNTPDSPEEASEIGSSIEQDHNTEDSAVSDDPEHKISQNNQESETSLCPLAEELHESSKDKSEDNSCQPTQLDSNEEDSEDEEGQSFDFDDMDIETAEATDPSKNQEQEEVEEGVDVMSDESSNGNTEPCQSDTALNEATQNKPNKSSDEKCTVDEGNQVDTGDKESGTVPKDNQDTLAHEEATADGARHIIEEGKVLDVGEVELGVVAENINQAMPLPVEQGLDAIKQELQSDQMSADQMANNKETPQSGKDAKKNGKKGKGKGKEECKMS